MQPNLIDMMMITMNFLFLVKEDQDHILIDIPIYHLDGITEETAFIFPLDITHTLLDIELRQVFMILDTEST